MKKVFCIILAVCFMILTVGCSVGDDSETSKSSDVIETVSNDTTEEEPNCDFGVITFNILAAAEEWAGYYYQEELTGDVISDAVYTRNLNVEEKYNIDLNYIIKSGGRGGMSTIDSLLTASVMGGTSDYDLFIGGLSYSSSYVLDGLFTNMTDDLNIDFSEPWWYKKIYNQLVIDDKQYIVSGMYSLNNTTAARVMFFNKS